MSPNARARARPLEDIRADIIERLRARQPEIEDAIYARIRAMSESLEREDAEYRSGQQAAIAAAVDYNLAGLEQAEGWPNPIPSAAAAQARRAARRGVSVDKVVLRYIAGHRLLSEFVMDEIDRDGPSSRGPVLRHLRRTQDEVLERFVAAVANEHRQERERVGGTAEQRRREIVQKLLAGEPVDVFDLGYQLDNVWHLGIIAMGAKAGRAVQGLADGLGRQLLSVPYGEGTVWAWLGGRELAIADVERLLSLNGIADVSLAVGEPGKGLDGWRLTHQEAQAALLVALRKPQALTRCSDVQLEAAVLRHETLTRSLVGSYLSPLEDLRIGGRTARETLRAYFICARNASSTAHFLGVARHTVENRLREIEKILGRSLPTCLAELEVVLRLEAIEDAPALALKRPQIMSTK